MFYLAPKFGKHRCYSCQNCKHLHNQNVINKGEYFNETKIITHKKLNITL